MRALGRANDFFDLGAAVTDRYQGFLSRVFPERFPGKDRFSSGVLAVRAIQPSSRTQVAGLGHSSRVAQTQPDRDTHAVIFIPLGSELSAQEQRYLLDRAVREMVRFRNKAMIVVTSQKIPVAELQKIEEQTEGRMVVLDAIAAPEQFLVQFFGTDRKIAAPLRTKVHGAVRQAYENAFGSGKLAIREISKHALVLGSSGIFQSEKSAIGQVSQQFSIQKSPQDRLLRYNAYLDYAVRIGGHLQASEIDESLRVNLSILEQGGISRISFTAQGLDRILAFLRANVGTQQISQSA
jgi:hypothetical protein